MPSTEEVALAIRSYVETLPEDQRAAATAGLAGAFARRMLDHALNRDTILRRVLPPTSVDTAIEGDGPVKVPVMHNRIEELATDPEERKQQLDAIGIKVPEPPKPIDTVLLCKVRATPRLVGELLREFPAARQVVIVEDEMMHVEVERRGDAVRTNVSLGVSARDDYRKNVLTFVGIAPCFLRALCSEMTRMLYAGRNAGNVKREKLSDMVEIVGLDADDASPNDLACVSGQYGGGAGIILPPDGAMGWLKLYFKAKDGARVPVAKVVVKFRGLLKEAMRIAFTASGIEFEELC